MLEQLGTFIGHNDAARLTPDNLLQWKAGLLEAGLRTKTIRDSKIAPLRAILQWGVDNVVAEAVPFTRQSVPQGQVWCFRSSFRPVREGMGSV